MSELNPEANNNGINVTSNGTTDTPKKGAARKFVDKVRLGYLKFRATKGGRLIITGAKGALITFGLIESYKAGQRSVKPTTVYIQAGVDDDAEENTPVEEPAEETPEEGNPEAEPEEE